MRTAVVLLKASERLAPRFACGFKRNCTRRPSYVTITFEVQHWRKVRQVGDGHSTLTQKVIQKEIHVGLTQFWAPGTLVNFKSKASYNLPNPSSVVGI